MKSWIMGGSFQGMDGFLYCSIDEGGSPWVCRPLIVDESSARMVYRHFERSREILFADGSTMCA